MAYASTESDRYQVYVRDFLASSGTLGAGKWMVSTDTGRAPCGATIAGSWSTMCLRCNHEAWSRGRCLRPVRPGSFSSFKANCNCFAAVPDLSRFLVAVAAEARGPQSFNVMLNWTSLLKQH